MRPPDEWIIGEGLEAPGRFYVIHAAQPMFMVEVCDDYQAPASGLTWSLADNQVACNAIFFDARPARDELDQLILSVGAILADYDERVQRRIRRDQIDLDSEL